MRGSLSSGGRIRSRLLTARERDLALARLARDPRRNLFLTEITEGVARPGSPGDVSSQVVGVWERHGDATDAELIGLAALRPSLVLDSQMEPRSLDLVAPLLESLETGLVKSTEPLVSALWSRLERRGRRAMVDRLETAYAVEPGEARTVDCSDDIRVRPAAPGDLESLVHAARASLREEQRPDPFEGDPVGFRRWVRGRLHRARVVEVDGSVAFVGYADVRRRDGWLIQGVYTWPEHRRRGLAAVGMSALIREAFDVGADHVQLAVVDGNEAALGLYRGLGFTPFDVLRTILFV